MENERRAGSLTFAGQGFVIDWNEKGVTIRVTDYHARELEIPWNTILDAAKAAGAVPPSDSKPTA